MRCCGRQQQQQQGPEHSSRMDWVLLQQEAGMHYGVRTAGTTAVVTGSDAWQRMLNSPWGSWYLFKAQAVHGCPCPTENAQTYAHTLSCPYEHGLVLAAIIQHCTVRQAGCHPAVLAALVLCLSMLATAACVSRWPLPPSSCMSCRLRLLACQTMTASLELLLEQLQV